MAVSADVDGAAGFAPLPALPCKADAGFGGAAFFAGALFSTGFIGGRFAGFAADAVRAAWAAVGFAAVLRAVDFGGAPFLAVELELRERGAAAAALPAEVLRPAAGFLAEDVAAERVFVGPRVARAGAFAVFMAGERLAAPFLAGFLAEAVFALLPAGACILVCFFFAFSVSAFFIFFAMTVLRSLRLELDDARARTRCAKATMEQPAYALG